MPRFYPDILPEYFNPLDQDPETMRSNSVLKSPIIEAAVLPAFPEDFDPRVCPARVPGCDVLNCLRDSCFRLGNRTGIDVSK